MKILIFIITYKASFRVNQIMKEIPFDYLKKFKYRILISDDCSSDDTKNYIDKIKKNNKKKVVTNFNSVNLGYGGNIKKCIKYAYKNKFDIAAMIHGDNQYSAKYLKEMIVLLTKNDCAAVTGSRMMKKKLARKGGMPFYKFIGNILLTKYFNFFHNTSFTDCHTGYWVYNLNKIKKKWVEKLDNGFLFDLDIRLKLVQKKLTVKEVQIITRYGTERSSMHIVYATRFFLRTFANKVLFLFK